MAKCRDCRKKKPNMNYSPQAVRGSIRKQKRQEMRTAKKERMKELAAKEAQESSVELSSGKTISQSVVSVVKLDVESSA